MASVRKVLFRNKKMVRLMIILNSGYNGLCDEILQLSYILVALQRHLRYASTGGTYGTIF